MKATTPRGRMKQVELWLRDNFPVAGVRVRFVDIPPDEGEDTPPPGDTNRTPGGFLIRIDRGAFERWGEELCETLIHEWAHAYVWRDHDRAEKYHSEHDAEWGVCFAMMYTAYFERGGRRKSYQFSPRPWK